MAVFVGRERELAELRGGLNDALAGRGRLFLLVGEPGIGKTRLAEELANLAAAGGAQVVWGRCWEGGGAPAYWPWMQVLRAVLRTPTLPDIVAEIGAAAAYVAQLLPEIHERLHGALAAPPPADTEQARFPLFDATTRLLACAAAGRPLVLILDDLHAADEPSLLLLEFLSRELHAAPLLVVGTYREVDLRRQPERGVILGRAARAGYRLPLAGLGEADVARLIENRGAGAPSTALLAAVYRTTEGNPFFVDEVVRLLVAEPGGLSRGEAGVLRIPHGVHDAIRERLLPLSDDCRWVLAVAAVIGREFDLGCLERVCTRATEPLLDVLGEAAAAGIVTAVSAASTRYSFAHALFRETLYDELKPALRLRLHRQIGEALEQLHAQEIGPHLAELAHHFLQAAPAGDSERAIAYATKAGHRAAAQLAYEDAAAHYRRALQAMEGAADMDVRRCQLLLALGEVQRASGNDDAGGTFEHAAELGRRLLQAGSPLADTWLARAALGFADRGLGTPQQGPDQAVIALVVEALTAIGDTDSKLRARLLGRLAMERAFDEEGVCGVELSQQAIDMARRLGDVPTLAATLSTRQFVLWRVDNIAARLSVSSEILSLAMRSGDKELALQGRTWRLIDLMGMGDIRSFDAEIDLHARAAEELRQPRYLWLSVNLRAMRALWAGHWQEALELAQESLALGERTGDQSATISPWVQIFVTRREQQRLAEEETAIKFAVERYPASPVPRTLLAVIYLDLERMAAAREQFELLAGENFSNLRRERRVGVLPYLAELCAAFGDRPRAAVLYELLSPYAHTIVPYGVVISFGAGAHYLALLAATLSRWDVAREHFEYALALHTRTDGKPWLAYTQYEYSRFLLGFEAADDRTRAVRLAEQALAGATAAHMPALATKAATLLECAGAVARSPLSLDEAARLRAYGGGTLPVTTSPLPDALADAAPERECNGKGRVLSFPTKNPPLRGRTHDPGLPRVRRTPEPPPVPAPQRGIFRLDGEYWSVGDSSAVLRLKDTKGLRYIANLLRHPRRDFHATELVALEGMPALDTDPSPFEHRRGDPLAQVSLRTLAAGEQILDARAKAAYKRRLEDLREALDEATRFNDVERAARARAEMEFLTQELARAVGLRGRDRPASSQAERARLNVTRAIKAVIRRISQPHPSLGRYLETTIKTGTFCSYTPDPRMQIRWEL
jgi:hypothetical protein